MFEGFLFFSRPSDHLKKAMIKGVKFFLSTTLAEVKKALFARSFPPPLTLLQKFQIGVKS